MYPHRTEASPRGKAAPWCVAILCLAGLAVGQGCSTARGPESWGLAHPKGRIVLPPCVATPDGMAMDSEGNIVVACPNYADMKKPAVFITIDKQNKVTKWFDCPVLKETGRACPMGIAFGPDGDLYVCDNQNWPTGNGENGEINQGRILRLRVKGNQVEKCTVVAGGMSHPNGVRIWKGQLYVTNSLLPKIRNDDGLLASGVYRFNLDDESIQVTNTRDDKNLIVVLKTLNPDCQYGADGIVFDRQGNLYIGNFGDGTIHKVTFDASGNVADTTVFAGIGFKARLKDPDFKKAMVKAKMRTTDGMCIDDKGNIYVADFSNNAVDVVDPKGNITVLTQNGDTDGRVGLLDQPGEPIVRGREMIVSNFDCVFGPDKVNTKHEMPAKMSVIDLP